MGLLNFLFEISDVYQWKGFFFYLHSITWTRHPVDTVLVNQRAVGKNHSLPQKPFGFNEWHFQEPLHRGHRNTLTSRGYCRPVLWCSQFLKFSPVTYLGLFNQLSRSLEMAQCHQKRLQSFVRLQVATLKPGFQELQDPSIANLNNHIQKPTSGRQKRGGVMQ